jgi:hypothetical protein
MSYPFTPIKKYSVKILITIVTCMMFSSLRKKIERPSIRVFNKLRYTDSEYSFGTFKLFLLGNG